MSPVTIGTSIEIVDELPPVVAPTATDGAFLIHSGATGVETFRTAPDVADALPGEADIAAMADAYFNEGGARLTLVPLVDNAGTPDVAATLEQVPADLGPGQVVAPEVVTGPEMAQIAAWAYETNRVYIADGPDAADDASLITLATALRGSAGARFASMEADTLIIPGIASGTTREVPASIVKAALIARSDLATGNPNVAAAGITNARCRYVIGIDAARSESERNTLAEAGVNAFRTIYGQAVVPYGFRTVADPDTLPLWWDLSGSRVVMAVRAREAEVNEAHLFGQVDGSGAFLVSYETSLARVLKELQSAGALFATSPSDPGYSVSAGWELNPREEIAQGRVRARITLRISPFAENIVLNIIRRSVAEEV
ncbi:hypothetical protein [Miltoncostaea marina]|uniref:hypothetical protein n=1 Tax=Miltoncostaea marina TaxID=2843215 RepID=UPI001C3CC411|nr:hypothetical protein [Miltoncostaea marina]